MNTYFTHERPLLLLYTLTIVYCIIIIIFYCSIYCHNVFVTLTDRFAGPMERFQAEAELLNRGNSTYLVRHRSRESTEYAISIKSVHCSCKSTGLINILDPVQFYTVD